MIIIITKLTFGEWRAGVGCGDTMPTYFLKVYIRPYHLNLIKCLQILFKNF